MTQQDPQKSSGSSTGKIIGIGCAVVFVVAIIGAIVLYFGVKKAMTGYVENFTATEAAQLAKPEGTREDSQAVIARFNAFVEALETGKEAEPLSLNGNEINQLIAFHPKWKGLSDKVRVTIDGDDVGGKVSMPLDDLAHLFEALKGRYLNGSATFTVGLTGGRLVIFLESLEVNGKTVPPEIMTTLKTENLADNSNKDPEFQKLFEKLESIAVENGKMTVIAKPAAARPVAAP